MPAAGPQPEQPRLVVDAMNVIGSRPTGWWRDRPAAIRDLVARVQAYAERRGAAVTVVIDGRPLDDVAEGRHGAVEVCYARRPGPDAADDRIVAVVEALQGEAEVVTADRNLQQRVQARGASTLSPSRWLAQLEGRPGEAHDSGYAGQPRRG